MDADRLGAGLLAGARDLAINGELRELSVAGGGGYALGSSAALAGGGAGDDDDDDAASVAAMAASAWYRLGWQLLRPRVAIAVLASTGAVETAAWKCQMALLIWP